MSSSPISHIARLTARVVSLAAAAALGRLHGVSVQVMPERDHGGYDTATPLLTLHVRLAKGDGLHATKATRCTLDDWMKDTRSFHSYSGDAYYYLDVVREEWAAALAAAALMEDGTVYRVAPSRLTVAYARADKMADGADAADRAFAEALDSQAVR